MMNSADIGSDSGKMICNVECTRRYEVCIVAHDGNKLVDCGARITGNYTCLCSNPSRVTGAIPTGGIVTSKKSSVTNSCSKIYCSSGTHCVNGKCVSDYKKAEVPGVSGKNNGAEVSTGSTGAVFTGDINGFTPEAKEVWNQLDSATQQSIISKGKSQIEIEKMFLIPCVGTGAGCVGEKMKENFNKQDST